MISSDSSKKRTKKFVFSTVRPKYQFVLSFFGRIRGYQKSFRNYLTFTVVTYVCRLQSCSGNEVYFYNSRLCLVFIFILVLPRFLAVHFSIAKDLIFSCWIQNFSRFETPVLKPVNFLPGLKQLHCLGIQPDKMNVFYSF